MSSGPIKVLFVSNIQRMSGAELVLLDFLDENRDIEAIVIAPSGELLDAAEHRGIRTYRSAGMRELQRENRSLWPLDFARRAPIAVIEIVRRARNERPHLIHVNNLAAGLYGLPAAAMMRLPVVWEIHDVIRHRTLEARVVRSLSPLTTRFIAVSQTVGRALETANVERERIHVVHNAIDSARFNPDAYDRGAIRRELGLSLAAPLFATIGQISEGKGTAVLLDAIEAADPRLPSDARFLLIGEAPPQSESYGRAIFARIAAAPILHERVIPLGRRHDIPRILADVDVVVQPSIYPEAFGLSLIEAIAMEKVVIATALGETLEIVEKSGSALLISPNDAVSLADALALTVEGSTLLGANPQSARDSVLRRFSRQRQRSQMKALYSEVITQRDAGSRNRPRP